MLPAVSTSPHARTTVARAAIAGATALALMGASVAPAQAFGNNERKFLQGVAAAMVMDRIFDDLRRQQQQPRYYMAQPAPVYVQPPVYQPAPIYQPAPVYRPAPVYAPPPVYRPAPVYQPSIYSSPVAQAFNSYGYTDRRRIQQQLAAYGYYRSSLDGSFGPGTYSAVVAYANDTGQGRALSAQAGAYGLFDSLLR
ncbi:Putative peptidoglycan binding domain-containing protein [Gemmobacter aquatilis]|uniref:Putative peptidoglycan binding domain-containing protein n=1 Tax=Gemmobacter aquatilis TaxID=933059 RepID=A0A1H8JLD8_9RHOB|nr:peptidoglycan-binding domain-containing protein [Gemmobacter aquatilis]SEN81583.1 Putative peptidoglycan binding domain-containing protein [Gemmobacter aquatilis]